MDCVCVHAQNEGGTLLTCVEQRWFILPFSQERVCLYAKICICASLKWWDFFLWYCCVTRCLNHLYWLFLSFQWICPDYLGDIGAFKRTPGFCFLIQKWKCDVKNPFVWFSTKGAFLMSEMMFYPISKSIQNCMVLINAQKSIGLRQTSFLGFHCIPGCIFADNKIRRSISTCVLTTIKSPLKKPAPASAYWLREKSNAFKTSSLAPYLEHWRNELVVMPIKRQIA